MHTILLIEDEKEINDLLAYYLKNNDFHVLQAFTAQEGIKKIEENEISLILLDLMLPDMDGFDLCRLIRDQYTCPMIMITAKVAEMDKITGLSLGADDYITKPFKPLEVIARIKAQIRRAELYSQKENKSILSIRDLEMDVSNRIVYLQEKELTLTPIEFAILHLLMENQKKTVSSEEIYRKVWKEKYFTSANNTIMVHIRHLRKKLGDSAENSKYIHTIWGVGYKID